MLSFEFSPVRWVLFGNTPFYLIRSICHRFLCEI
jgi:hypothetical protein